MHSKKDNTLILFAATNPGLQWREYREHQSCVKRDCFAALGRKLNSCWYAQTESLSQTTDAIFFRGTLFSIGHRERKQ